MTDRHQGSPWTRCQGTTRTRQVPGYYQDPSGTRVPGYYQEARYSPEALQEARYSPEALQEALQEAIQYSRKPPAGSIYSVRGLQTALEPSSMHRYTESATAGAEVGERGGVPGYIQGTTWEASW